MKAEDNLSIKYEQLDHKVQEIKEKIEAQRQFESEEYCNSYGMPGHTSYSCPNIYVYQEQGPVEVNAMNGPRGQNSYGNAYNPRFQLEKRFCYFKSSALPRAAISKESLSVKSGNKFSSPKLALVPIFVHSVR